MILRDMNKLYAGLHRRERIEAEISNAETASETAESFATGHWGCGAFGGDKQLKALQQWIAVSACKLKLHYFPFGDERFTQSFQKLVQAVTASETPITVGKLTHMMLNAIKESRRSIFDHILSQLAHAPASGEAERVESPSIHD